MAYCDPILHAVCPLIQEFSDEPTLPSNEFQMNLEVGVEKHVGVLHEEPHLRKMPPCQPRVKTLNPRS